MTSALRKTLLGAAAALGLIIAVLGGLAVYFYATYFHWGIQRFETVAPSLPSSLQHPAILIFSKTNGFRDDAAIQASTKALIAIARKNGWSVYVTENAAVFNSRQLALFDAVVWNNTSGSILLPAQQKAFRRYIEAGGGFVGIHGAGGDPVYDWQWYVRDLIGAQFIGHTLFPYQQQATVITQDSYHPVTRHVPSRWVRTDEWYSFASPDLSRIHVLLSVDERTYDPRMAWKDIRMGTSHPIVWNRCIGKGRALYSALGHTPASYTEPVYVGLLSRAIAWAAGILPGQCQLSQSSRAQHVMHRTAPVMAKPL